MRLNFSLVLALLIAAALLHSTIADQNGDLDVGIIKTGGTRQSRKDHDPKFCFVVRTYWGHGDDRGGGLRNLIKSLQQQKHSRWEAVILAADSKPFSELHSIVQSLEDNRVWVFAEWIGEPFTPMENNDWVPGYHSMLFNLTDDAVKVCSPDTDWLIITNGDNLYAKGFLERVIQESTLAAAAGNPVDIIAFDFYSRFLRSTRPSCDRFALQEAFPCKRNRLRWCQTDLGANAIDYRRFIEEKRKFGVVDTSNFSGGYRGLDDPHNDGLLMQLLMDGGWKAVHVHDVCLFNHSPSPQECAWDGGAWDDRDTVTIGGGSCITLEQAEELLEKAAENVETESELEIVTMPIASDGKSSAFGIGKYHPMSRDEPLLLKCLRRKDYKSADVWGNALAFYSGMCADSDLDGPSFNASLAAFWPDEWEEMVEERMMGFDQEEDEEGDDGENRGSGGGGSGGFDEEEEEKDEEYEQYYANYRDEL